MPDYRRAWHRGGACLFKAVTARAHDLPARDVDVLRAAKHRDVRERPRPRIRPKKKPGLFENGTADQITRATCHLSHVTCHQTRTFSCPPAACRSLRSCNPPGHAAQYASLLRPTCYVLSPALGPPGRDLELPTVWP
jgi:hypothetical protein